MSPFVEDLVQKAVQALREQLGQNLNCCCLYGSAVRGNFVAGQSDINLLIVVGTSDPAAHEAIARAIGGQTAIDPFIIGQAALARSARAFASKFVSIKQNYRVIYGADPLADLIIDPVQQRFLCEQALRNLQLRMTYAFVTRQRSRAYRRFLLRIITPLFVQFSEVLQLEGVEIPKEFELRIPLFEKHFGFHGQVLRQLLACKMDPEKAAETTDELWHEQLFPIVSVVVAWVDRNWLPK